MGHGHERGKKEQKDEENGQMIASFCGARSIHERTLNHEVGIVKTLISCAFVGCYLMPLTLFPSPVRSDR